MSDAVPQGMREDRLNKEILRSNLTGLANNTKWNELINYMRSLSEWRPSYRSKSINGYITEWDTEWYYHLPFPFKLVLWLDIGCVESKLPNEINPIDHSQEFEKVFSQIGFEFEKTNDIIRIFGYDPKDYSEFT